MRREEAAEALNKAQAASYEVGGTLARIEQQIQHQREMATRLQRARDEAMTQLAEIASHIGNDQSKLDVLRASIEESEPRLEQLRAEDDARQDALRDAEAKLNDWQQRWDAHTRAQSEAARAADVERTRIEHLDRQSLDADRRREALTAERAGLDLAALADAFAGIQEQHDTQKESLDTLTTELETRKHALTELQDQQRTAQTELADVRKSAQASRHGSWPA